MIHLLNQTITLLDQFGNEFKSVSLKPSKNMKSLVQLEGDFDLNTVYVNMGFKATTEKITYFTKDHLHNIRWILQAVGMRDLAPAGDATQDRPEPAVQGADLRARAGPQRRPRGSRRPGRRRPRPAVRVRPGPRRPAQSRHLRLARARRPFTLELAGLQSAAPRTTGRPGDAEHAGRGLAPRRRGPAAASGTAPPAAAARPPAASRLPRLRRATPRQRLALVGPRRTPRSRRRQPGRHASKPEL